MPRGGRRPNTGPKKGARYKPTIEKAAAREALRQIVLAKLKPLTEAQITNAMGLSHLFLRDDSGKFIRITDPDQIEVILNSGEQDKYFYIQTKDPSIQAFTDLMNRAIDKPAEQVQEVEHKGTIVLRHELGD